MLVHLQGPWTPLLGRLTLQQIPYHVPILVVTFIVVAILAAAVLAATTYFGKWGYLWREWLTTVDHKKNRCHVYFTGAGHVVARIR